MNMLYIIYSVCTYIYVYILCMCMLYIIYIHMYIHTHIHICRYMRDNQLGVSFLSAEYLKAVPVT